MAGWKSIALLLPFSVTRTNFNAHTHAYVHTRWGTDHLNTLTHIFIPMGHLTAIRYEGLINMIISVFTPAALSPLLPLSFLFSPSFAYPGKEKRTHVCHQCATLTHVAHVDAGEWLTHTHTMNKRRESVWTGRGRLLFLPLACNHAH